MIDVTMMDHALRYAARGWHLLPLHWPINGRCSCGKQNCPTPAKHPRTSNGLKDATTNPEQIRDWWTQWPSANIGVRTGKITGVVVVDIDAAKGDATRGGLEAWEEFQDINGRVETLTVHTGGGGLHLWFQAPVDELKSSASEIAPGIDTQAEGGYAVAPPSLHISGKRYRWEGEGP